MAAREETAQRLLTTNQYNSHEAGALVTCEPSRCEGRKIIEAVFGEGVEVGFSARDCSAVNFEARDYVPTRHLTGGCGLIIRTMINARLEGRI